MENEVYFMDLLKILVPAIAVLAVAVLSLKQVAGKRQPNQEQTLPLQLQAYERLVLLVERITPSSLLLRNHRTGISATELNAQLIAEIRAEFEHNITQQLYVSEISWQRIRSLKDRTVSMINDVVRTLPEDASGMDLNRAVLSRMSSLEQDPYQDVLASLREEVRAFF